jgi:hypothetical protein
MILATHQRFLPQLNPSSFEDEGIPLDPGARDFVEKPTEFREKIMVERAGYSHADNPTSHDVKHGEFNPLGICYF